MEEMAFSFVEEALEDSVEINGIIAENDSLAGMAIEALSEAGVADNVLTVGQDGDLAACQRIAGGTQLCTVYKPYDQLALAVSEAAEVLVSGHSLELTETIDSGGAKVPYYRIEPILVTKNNLQSAIIDNNIYREEDIY